MLTVISHNPSKTVGLVDGDNPESDRIGPFSPLALKEWVDQIIEHFGDYIPRHCKCDGNPMGIKKERR
jgi:hypothetical protein